MNKLTLLQLLLLCFFSCQLLGQNEANIWALNNYQLDFNKGVPIVKKEFAEHLNRGMGIISDKNGSLLFYTDGFSVWNRNHNMMSNGADLIPSHQNTNTQESIVIPRPGTDNKYYIFTVDPWNGQETSGLYYAEVDMSLEGGMGGVISKSTRLIDSTTNKICATMHENGEDIWLLTNKRYSNIYYSYLVTKDGILESPIINEIGNSSGYYAGQLKFSPDGKNVVCSNDYMSSDQLTFTLMDFDKSSGVLFNPQFIGHSGVEGCEGIEFSSDCTKLYVSQAGIYQYDLTNPSIKAISDSRYLLQGGWSNSPKQIQLAPDGNIYITKGGGDIDGTNYLAVISNANLNCINVLVEENGLYLEGASSFVGFTPNFISNYLFKTSFTYENTCQTEPTIFKITNDHQLESVEWFFGEGSTSTLINPKFTYDEPGTYKVELIAFYKNRTDTITKDIIINPLPTLIMSSDTTMCFGSELEIDDLYASYSWSTGDTINSTVLETEGWYKLEVENEFGCQSSDSIYANIVELPQIVISDTILITEGDSVLVKAGEFHTYEWSNGETTPSIHLSDKGWFSVQVSNEFGCKSSKSFYTTFNEEPTPEPKSDWIRLSPKPTGLPGNDMCFINKKVGFIVNNEEIIRTTDGGLTWEVQIKITSGNRITFKDSYGFIIGDSGTIYKSTHNGAGWNKLKTSFKDNLNAITVIHQDTVLVTSGNKLFKSNDGGGTWEMQKIDLEKLDDYGFKYYSVVDSYFINSNIGHVACTNGAILKTIDGGKSWYVTESSNLIPSNFYRIRFVNNAIGFASQEHNEILKTTDGGETWVKISSPSDAAYSIHFINENIGFLACEHGAMHKTLDCGKTWIEIGPEERIWANDLYSIFFLDVNVGYATGLRGRILKTIDGGVSWEEYSPIYRNISQLDFLTSKTGYASVGRDLYKTTNGGLDWIKIETDLPISDLGQFDFVNEQIGFIIMGGCVYKTINGGINWEKTHDNLWLISENLYCIDFLSEKVGFVSGGWNAQSVFKTTDGGKTWTKVESIRFAQIQFINSQIGYARNYRYPNNRIYKTVDGGETWTKCFETDDVIDSIESFHFIDENIGYFVGNNGITYKTINSGDSWEKIETPYKDYVCVKFYSRYVGYILDENGCLFQTLDGGVSWKNCFNLYGIKSIKFCDMDIYLSGDRGSILKSTLNYKHFVDVTPLSLTDISDSTATVNSTIKSSLDTTRLLIELGTQSGSYDQSFDIGLFSNYLNQDISYTFEELEPSTEYFCRLKIVDGNKITLNPELSFTTESKDLVDLTPLSLTNISESTATVNSKLRSTMNSTQIVIELGKQTGYYDQAFELGLYHKHIDQAIIYTFENLEPSTEYFCQLKIIGEDKTTLSSELSFITESTLVTNIVDEIEKTNISIYPNPARDFVKIKISGQYSQSTFSIYDLSGKMLLEGKMSGSIILDISNLTPGLYILKLENGKITRNKIIKL